MQPKGANGHMQSKLSLWSEPSKGQEVSCQRSFSHPRLPNDEFCCKEYTSRDEVNKEDSYHCNRSNL